MPGNIPSDIARLDIHHVGYLTWTVPDLWDNMGRVFEFECDCYFKGQTEFVIPFGGTLEKRLKEVGPHLHHVAYGINTFDFFPWLKERDLLLYQEPVKGVPGMVNFIHPKHFGVLIELVAPHEEDT